MTVQTTLAERAIAKVLQASCQSPVASFAVVHDGQLQVTALVALPDGSESIRDSINGLPQNAEQLGEELAARLLEQGARELLDAAATSHA
jgi:hydroxymethylbilane synthase